ncbi:MAG TPA: sialate O-acetylesterase [Chitinophaga sp.]|uniref:sialate O-acetylesterase n=1 Tax=Chitinophaga sp. TaxID=1869181 RepID=UPI002C11001E|nr:sialate O-acetylesterase [Chitinophaga sp.]HVI44342.1 sialate O-acetylesterase [Chitinophaga sp.]
MTNKIRLTTIVLLLIINSIYANVTLPRYFSNGMVLQRNQPIYIRGWADRHEKITVQFRQQQQHVKAGADGKWMVKLKPEEAGGPFELTVKGKNTLVFQDVLIGEVWVCSGQSNMEFPVKDVINAGDEISQAQYPQIREFTVKRAAEAVPQEDVSNSGGWQTGTPENVGGFTAVGYFFARELYNRLHVPIGLIHTSWGGTQIEPWTSGEAFTGNDEFKEIAEKQLGYDSARGLRTCPSALYNAMIHPLLPYGIKGVIWYQGESNAGHALQYRKLFPLMITDWRRQWKQGDFPFYFVQLATYDPNKGKVVGNSNNGSTYAELREAQDMALALPNTGMAVTTDLGDPRDIHPKNKQDVGKRLAMNALKNVYAQEVVPSGPRFAAVKFVPGKALVSFTDTGSGFFVKDKYGYLRGFEVAGADKHFHYAKASIVNGNIEVYNEEVTNPVAVRYNWADDASDGNLYNREGFPAAPFRSDH